MIGRLPTDRRYLVSDRGKVWSEVKGQRKRLYGSQNKKGYIIIELAGGRRAGIHQLVLETFIGPCPKGKQSRHLDGNPKNNNITNLVYGTPTRNNRDKIRHGTITRGEQVNTSKHSKNDVIRIRRLMNRPPPNGMVRRKRGLVQSLTKRYKVSRTALYLIASGKNWGWLG